LIDEDPPAAYRAGTMSELPPISPEGPADFDDVEALIERAFGPGRYAKTAERLRETNRQLQGVSMIARDGQGLAGCTRMWPIKVGDTPAVLLGPFAVAERWRGKGVGRAMVARACEEAAARGYGAAILVGDATYFDRMGFAPIEKGKIRLPGPVSPKRLLIRELTPGAADSLSGLVSAG
jgi:predicted N-acetyltransferase YhbS